MKVMLGAAVDSEILETLRVQAKEKDTSVSRLVNRMLRGCLQMPLDAPSGPAKLTAKEKRVMDGYRLCCLAEGAWRFSAAEIRKQCGLYPSEIEGALRGMMSKGIFEKTNFTPTHSDRLDREFKPLPVEYWSCKQGEVWAKESGK